MAMSQREREINIKAERSVACERKVRNTNAFIIRFVINIC